MTFHRTLASALAVAAMATVIFALPADAAKKERKQYRSGTPSLDGRVTGRPRTCGFDYYVYDERGIPVGPYCH